MLYRVKTLKQNILVLLIASLLVIGSVGIGVSVITNVSKVGDEDTNCCCFDITVYKYNDLNRDGRWQEEEEGIEDWYFELFEKDAPEVGVNSWPWTKVDEGYTDENGELVFENYCYGQHYMVREHPGPEYVCTEPEEDYEFTEEGYVEYSFWLECCGSEVEFGNAPAYGDIEVCKYHDADMSGTWNGEEEGLEDWTFKLWNTTDELPDEIIGDGTTGEDGCLLWEDIPAGFYYVQEIVEDGWECTNGTDYQGLTVKAVTVMPGETSYVEFGNVHLTDLRVYKYYDEDYNGAFNSGDYVLNGWRFTLGEMSGTTGDDGVGYVIFEDLYPGTYTVTEHIEEKEGYYSTTGTEEEIVIESCMDSTQVWFGNTEYVEITIEKFNDLNGNSQHDCGEPLVDVGVPFNGAGAGGFFLNEFLVTGEHSWLEQLPGYYEIEEIVPEGWYPTTDTLQDATLSPGEHYTFSFGNTQYGDIEVYKFCDQDYDGIYDEDEQLIDGFQFQLWSAYENGTPIEPIGDPVDTTDGMYTFEDLEAGHYVVQEIIPEDECNWCPTTGLLHYVYVEAGMTNDTWFGNVPGCSTIEGMKFKDIEADGHFDVGLDMPLMNWEIRLWSVNETGQPGDILETEYTDRCGMYEFDCICPGEYYVQEVMQDGWYAVTSELVHVEIEPCETETVDFANCVYKDIYGIKFYDYNMNSEYDEEDWVLPDWTIILKDESGEELERTMTTECGYYFFEGLSVGTYYVEEVLPEGWNNTTPMSVEVELTCCNPCRIVNFGNYEYPDITVYKFNDLDKSGTWNGEEPLVDEEVLFNGQGAGGFFYEDYGITGQYTFEDVEVGDYMIEENVPEGWMATTLTEQHGTLGPGDHWEVYFGNVQYGNITVYKFYDWNMNEEHDEGEEMLEGWTMTLFDSGMTEMESGVTDENGEVTFEDVEPGDYYVQETLKECWYNTRPLTQPVEAVAGEESYVWFGNVECGMINGYKYCDFDMDEEYDEDEEPIEGWEIYLYECEQEPQSTNGDWIAMTTTDENGYYEFDCVCPGMYRVVEEDREGWYHSSPAEVYVEMGPAGEERVDFGNYMLGDIWGMKFCDVDRDGEFQYARDVPLAGWNITLWTANEEGEPTGMIAWQLTDTGGHYMFEDLEPGHYVVKEIMPGCGWYNVTPSEVYVKLGCIPDEEVNFANWRHGMITVFKYNDTDHDGEYDEGEQPIEGWEIELWNADQSEIVASGFTSPEGYIQFIHLEPGDYWVHDVPQCGWDSSTPNWVQVTVKCCCVEVWFGNYMEDEEEPENAAPMLTADMFIAVDKHTITYR